MYWWIGTLLGSLFLAFKNYLSRILELTPRNAIILTIPLILAGWAYWYGFKNAPKFVNCWFLGTAFNSLSAILIGLIVFDKSLSQTTVIGIILVVSGAYLLIK